MILSRVLRASAASSRNLSRRSVASSTVMPITLISSKAPASPRCEVTVTLCSLAAGEVDFGAGAASSTPVISSSATFIRSGPASISADDPSIRLNSTGLLNPRTRILAPGCNRSASTASIEAACTPRSDCDSEMVSTSAAFSASRLAADVLHLPPGRFLHLRAQLPFFHRFDDARDILVKALVHLRELRFQFFDPLVLPFEPLCSQLLAVFLQRMPLGGHLPLHAVQLVAAAMQISDQVRRFARFGRQQ